MAEIDPALTVGIIGGSVGSFLIAWFVNGKLARDFEKRKRKYDVKLERYSAVADCLRNVHWAALAGNSSRRLMRALSNGELLSLREGTMNRVYVSFLDQVKLVKMALDLDVFPEWAEVFSKRLILGVEFEEIESIGLEKATEIARQKLYDYSGDLGTCMTIIVTRLRKGCSDIIVVGGEQLAERIEKWYRSWTGGEVDPDEMWSAAKVILTDLSKDLEDTL